MAHPLVKHLAANEDVVFATSLRLAEIDALSKTPAGYIPSYMLTEEYHEERAKHHQAAVFFIRQMRGEEQTVPVVNPPVITIDDSDDDDVKVEKPKPTSTARVVRARVGLPLRAPPARPSQPVVPANQPQPIPTVPLPAPLAEPLMAILSESGPASYSAPPPLVPPGITQPVPAAPLPHVLAEPMWGVIEDGNPGMVLCNGLPSSSPVSDDDMGIVEEYGSIDEYLADQRLVDHVLTEEELLDLFV
ncbi:uncharacterized protein LOC129593185 [Paramacrobiotus metropolitanus]|uniref:uncharacterized protein LOC129592527 n=1 Tax=Paramacrobiotus metropolitanus TaxID=2943436 RepID=UPI0024464EF1|nr:uncharacterized protein LOC129592527 [Paramacrobiotus metropolitanus]XP_055345368.1 uncharacterized protein LOC129593185 [Paramacrobiotus metropolitanus]